MKIVEKHSHLRVFFYREKVIESGSRPRFSRRASPPQNDNGRLRAAISYSLLNIILRTATALSFLNEVKNLAGAKLRVFCDKICPLAHTAKFDGRKTSKTHEWGKPHSTQTAYDTLRRASSSFAKNGKKQVGRGKTCLSIKNVCGCPQTLKKYMRSTPNDLPRVWNEQKNTCKTLQVFSSFYVVLSPNED